MRFETGTEATNEQLLETLARQRLERFRRRSPVTRDQITRTVQEILRREEERRSEARGEPFSFAKAVRGLCALRHQSILMDSAQEDAEYAQRALTTGATPGSYLIPSIQADAIVGQLAGAGGGRAHLADEGNPRFERPGGGRGIAAVRLASAKQQANGQRSEPRANGV